MFIIIILESFFLLIPRSGSSVGLSMLANSPPDDRSHFLASLHCFIIFNSMWDILIKKTVGGEVDNIFCFVFPRKAYHFSLLGSWGER